MRPAASFAILFSLLSPVAALAVGTAHSENFNVMAPSKELAQTVAGKAESYRKLAALEWFGRELPAGKDRTILTVFSSADEDEGLSWPINDPQQKCHRIWITTTAEKAGGELLYHEVVHTVLASFVRGGSLPRWADEGIASQVDDAIRLQSREQLVETWASQGRLPQLQSLFTTKRITHNDTDAYAAAASVTRFLATLGGKPKVVEFAKAGMHGDWDQATRDIYGLHGVADLQTRWENWVREGIAPKPPARRVVRAGEHFNKITDTRPAARQTRCRATTYEPVSGSYSHRGGVVSNGLRDAGAIMISWV